MPLPVTIASLDDLPEALRESLRGEYVPGDDGKLHLGIVVGGKTTTATSIERAKATLLSEKKQLEDAIQPLRAVIGERTPEELKTLLDTAGKHKDLDLDKLRTSWVSEWEKSKLAPVLEKATKLEAALTVERLDKSIMAALQKAEADPEAMPFLVAKAKERVELQGEQLVVKDEHGQPSVHNVEQFVLNDLRTKLPRYFLGSAAGGSGAAGSGGPPADGTTRTLQPANHREFGDNLADIAAGKVKVPVSF